MSERIDLPGIKGWYRRIVGDKAGKVCRGLEEC